MSENDDMRTMPVRDLIDQLRTKVVEMPPEMMLQKLIISVLIRRLEDEADRADRAETQLREGRLNGD